ncbi:hypothetical protein AB6B38_03850 [Glycocaulis abyssi]|uniref:Uncharacterized protein n=1 Tax=Glycocaulis abyssi TaxID=1433403 RepID=A0ABV9N611_9PROT
MRLNLRYAMISVFLVDGSLDSLRMDGRWLGSAGPYVAQPSISLSMAAPLAGLVRPVRDEKLVRGEDVEYFCTQSGQ